MPTSSSKMKSGIPKPWLFKARDLLARMLMPFIPSHAHLIAFAWWRKPADDNAGRRRPSDRRRLDRQTIR